MSAEERLASLLRKELERVRPAPGAWASLRARLQDEAPTPLWHRVWEHGMSRRQFLGSAATATAAALLPAPPWIWRAPAAPSPPADLPVFAPPTPDEHDLYLPGIGFRRPRGMASRQPVSTRSGDLTLTVRGIAVMARGTWLDLEVAGLERGPDGTESGGIDVQLRADGVTRTPRPGVTRARRDESGGITIRRVLRMGPLGPDLTEVEVIVSGELIAGELRAVVPLVSAVEAGLPAVRLAGEAVTVGGVSIRVTNAVLSDPTVLLLRIVTPPPYGFVWLRGGIGGRVRGEELVLRDAQGREYLEELPLGGGFSHDPAVFDDVVHFPRLPADASDLRLVVPQVTLGRHTGDAVVIEGPWIVPLGL